MLENDVGTSTQKAATWRNIWVFKKIKEIKTKLTLASWQCSVFSVSTSSGCSDLVGWLTDCRKLSKTPLNVNLFMAAPCWKNMQLTRNYDDRRFGQGLTSFFFFSVFSDVFIFFDGFFSPLLFFPSFFGAPLRTNSALRNHVTGSRQREREAPTRRPPSWIPCGCYVEETGINAPAGCRFSRRNLFTRLLFFFLGNHKTENQTFFFSISPFAQIFTPSRKHGIASLEQTSKR